MSWLSGATIRPSGQPGCTNLGPARPYQRRPPINGAKNTTPFFFCLSSERVPVQDFRDCISTTKHRAIENLSDARILLPVLGPPHLAVLEVRGRDHKPQA